MTTAFRSSPPSRPSSGSRHSRRRRRFSSIFGALDTLVPADSAKIYGRVPGARVEMVDGAGHSPMVEKPAETLRLIEGFLPPVP